MNACLHPPRCCPCWALLVVLLLTLAPARATAAPDAGAAEGAEGPGEPKARAGEQEVCVEDPEWDRKRIDEQRRADRHRLLDKETQGMIEAALEATQEYWDEQEEDFLERFDQRVEALESISPHGAQGLPESGAVADFVATTLRDPLLVLLPFHLTSSSPVALRSATGAMLRTSWGRGWLVLAVGTNAPAVCSVEVRVEPPGDEGEIIRRVVRLPAMERRHVRQPLDRGLDASRSRLETRTTCAPTLNWDAAERGSATAAD